MPTENDLLPRLLRLKSEIDAAEVQSSLARLAEAVKYDPNQPRVPAGNPDGGQWASGSSNGEGITGNDASGFNPFASFDIAARAGNSESYCWNQLTIDNLRCNAIVADPLRAACRSQAMQRYAACLRGQPLPPLLF